MQYKVVSAQQLSEVVIQKCFYLYQENYNELNIRSILKENMVLFIMQ